MKTYLATAVSALALAVAAPAFATITVISNPPFPPNPPENVLLTSGSTGTTLTGTTNQTNTTVVFTSSTDTLVSPPQGQAFLAATDNTLGNLNIALANKTLGFTSFEFNINSPTNQNISLVFTDQFGQTQVADGGTTTFSVGANGSNFINALATNGEVITNVSLTGTNLTSVGQVRLGGVAAFRAVPEPATWAMLIMGFGGVGALMRSKRRSSGRALAAA
jgi:hypothetical protein